MLGLPLTYVSKFLVKRLYRDSFNLKLIHFQPTRDFRLWWKANEAQSRPGSEGLGAELGSSEAASDH